MKSRHIRLAALFPMAMGGLLGSLGCSSTSPAPAPASDPVADYLDTKWGIRLSGLEEAADNFIVQEDNSVFTQATAHIDVDGLGGQDLEVTELVDSAQNGGDATFFVSLPGMVDERYFLFSPKDNYITIGDGTQGAAVSQNPDGTYEVWTFVGDSKDMVQTVPNGLEALKLIEQYNGFKDTTPFILLTGFAAAHYPAYDARGLHSCKSDTAAPPVVCDIFKEFCDCAACSVMNKAGACELCPGL